MRERLSKKILNVTPSATLEITALANKLRAEGKDVVNFGAGEPDFSTPDHICEAAHKAIRDGLTRYTPSTGIKELKEAVAKKLHDDNGLAYPSSQIIISCGAKHSLYNVLQVLCNEGDEVVIIAPFWVSYPEMVTLAGAVSRIVHTDPAQKWQLDPEQLKSAITPRTKAIIINNPSNPAGVVFPPALLKEILALAEKHDFFIISDEIYEKIYFAQEPYCSIGALTPKALDRVITVNGPSKSYAMTGWRIGYLVAPDEITKAISKIQSHSTSNPTSISQWAALASLVGDQSYVREACTAFKERRDYALERLSAMEGVSCVCPEGAFYLFIDVSSAGLSSMDFCKRLLNDDNVAAIPGLPFGYDTHIRLSFATSREQIEKGLDRLVAFIEKVR